jgi:hypothetical protein
MISCIKYDSKYFEIDDLETLNYSSCLFYLETKANNKIEAANENVPYDVITLF